MPTSLAAQDQRQRVALLLGIALASIFGIPPEGEGEGEGEGHLGE